MYRYTKEAMDAAEAAADAPEPAAAATAQLPESTTTEPPGPAAEPATEPAAEPAAPAAGPASVPAEAAQAPNAPGNCMYELRGIVVHSGTANAGHYYSYIKVRVAHIVCLCFLGKSRLPTNIQVELPTLNSRVCCTQCCQARLHSVSSMCPVSAADCSQLIALRSEAMLSMQPPFAQPSMRSRPSLMCNASVKSRDEPVLAQRPPGLDYSMAGVFTSIP